MNLNSLMMMRMLTSTWLNNCCVQRFYWKSACSRQTALPVHARNRWEYGIDLPRLREDCFLFFQCRTDAEHVLAIFENSIWVLEVHSSIPAKRLRSFGEHHWYLRCYNNLQLLLMMSFQFLQSMSSYQMEIIRYLFSQFSTQNYDQVHLSYYSWF